MIENLKRYTMVVRRDHEGYATPALKIRRKGEVVKFSDIEEAFRSASHNKQSVLLTCLKCGGEVDPTDDIICGVCYNTNQR